jgi:hypothetical protein
MVLNTDVSSRKKSRDICETYIILKQLVYLTKTYSSVMRELVYLTGSFPKVESSLQSRIEYSLMALSVHKGRRGIVF